MTAQWVPVVAIAALCTWLAVFVRVWRARQRGEVVPDALREGAWVAIAFATVGGLLSSLGFWNAISTNDGTFLAMAWRAGVLVSGVYALIGSAMDGRADRE